MRAYVLELTVPLCKWTDISMRWKEQSLCWREQVKIALWIISPPDPCHCCCPYTWQGQKEMILLFQPKPVLLVYGLKRGKERGNILMESRASVAGEQLCASWKGSVARSCCSAHHLPSSFSCSLVSLSLPFTVRRSVSQQPRFSWGWVLMK